MSFSLSSLYKIQSRVCQNTLVSCPQGKREDRKPLLILFSEDAMGIMLNAAVTAGTQPLSEHHYQFLKKLCQVCFLLQILLAACFGRK